MAETAPIPVALFVQHALMRSCLQLGLEMGGEFAVVHASGMDEAGLMAAARASAPALVVVDLCPHGGNGPAPDVLAWIAAHWAGAAALALTEGYEPGVLQEAAAKGCRGFFCVVRSAFSELAPALRQLDQGGSHLPPDALRALAQQAPPRMESGRERVLRLCTRRELLVIELICAPDDPDWQTVADRAGLRKVTVEGHAGKVYRKLGLKGKSALVSYARGLGFGRR